MIICDIHNIIVMYVDCAYIHKTLTTKFRRKRIYEKKKKNSSISLIMGVLGGGPKKIFLCSGKCSTSFSLWLLKEIACLRSFIHIQKPLFIPLIMVSQQVVIIEGFNFEWNTSEFLKLDYRSLWRWSLLELKSQYFKSFTQVFFQKF